MSESPKEVKQTEALDRVIEEQLVALTTEILHREKAAEEALAVRDNHVVILNALRKQQQHILAQLPKKNLRLGLTEITENVPEKPAKEETRDQKGT